MSEIINFSWPDGPDEEEIKNRERRIRSKAHELIQKGKLDLYEYSLYIEQQMNLQELMAVVEKQIREDRINQLREMRTGSHD